MINKLTTEFDNAFSAIPNLSWLPWIGSNFKKTNLLLIGDSYYDDGDDWIKGNINASRDLINNQGINSDKPEFSNSAPFLRKTEKIVLSKDSTTFEERNNFWTSVAYCNLVQRLLPERDSVPNNEDLKNGWKTILEVVKIIQPSVIIKLGLRGDKELYSLLENYQDWEYLNNTELQRVVDLKNNDRDIRLVIVDHPSGSRNFIVNEWADIISKANPNLSSLFNA